MTRNRRQPDRLAGGGGTLVNVDEALANWDDEMELEEAGSDAEAEDEPMQERSGRAAKAARRGWGRCTAAGPKPLDPAAFSDLLAAAPRLVDLLLEEDKIRSITLVARDVCNLAIAGGGRISVAPIWSALATRLRLKEAAELKAKQEAEEEAAKEAEMARKDAAAVAAASPGGAPPQPQQPTAEAQSPAERKGRKAPHRRGRQPKPPPPPSDLDYVRAAVARDPARYSEVRKTQQQWEFRLSARDLQYRCFIASGVADGLPALLAVAARQAAARQEAMERERELDERLEAVGLGRSEVVSCAVTSWLQRGEGDIEGLVDRARARVDRELELLEALCADGLL